MSILPDRATAEIQASDVRVASEPTRAENRTDAHRDRQESGRLSVLFINRSYWPDGEATGQLLTELCEDLGQQFEITVLAGQPNQNLERVRFARSGREVRNGVGIRRVRHTRFHKRFFAGRIINYLTFLIGAVWVAIWLPRPDIVVVETDPPLLPILGRLFQWRGAKLIVYLQDIHPDIAVAVGKLRNGIFVRMVRWFLFRIYRGADRVIVLSRDMQQRVVDSGVDSRLVEVIPNWIDTDLVYPLKNDNDFRQQQDIDGRFLVMYSGNLGLCQCLEDVITAANHLRHREDILFLLVGGGALKQRLEEQARQLELGNVRFLPYQPKNKLAESLSAADLHLVPLDPRVAPCLMPSKLYGVLASGTPLLAIAPDDCELAQLTLQHHVGVVAPPGEPEALAEIIESIVDRPWGLAEMGRRARLLAQSQYDRRKVVPRFAAVLWGLARITPYVGHAQCKADRKPAVHSCKSV